MNNINSKPRKIKRSKTRIYLFAAILGLVLVLSLAIMALNSDDISSDPTPTPQITVSVVTSAPENTPIVSEPSPTDKPSVTSTPTPNTTNTPTINKSAWNLILVNPWNKLPDDFTVVRTELSDGHSIDERVYPELQQMMDDARAEGLSPLICSSYRTAEYQQNLFDNLVNRYVSEGSSQEDAETRAATWIAVPGTSEHQTGLTLDIVAQSYQTLNKEQEDTAEQIWLMANSYKYGFILRFPEDKTEITGIQYEPWHYRYVGKEAAKEIYENKICLEEYLDS